MLLKVFLVNFVLLCLLWPTFGVDYGPSDVRVVKVKEGSNVVLPFSPGKQDLRSKRFQWMKEDPNGSKRAFGYVQGKYSSNDLDDQDQQFKGRVSHFGDELQHGNASIKIHNTKVEDSGTYICDFYRLDSQIFRVELVVDAAPLLHIKLSDATLLHRDVQGASRCECQCNIPLLSTVNRTDHCCCVVTDGSEIPWGWLLISGFVGLVIGWSTFALAVGVIIIVAPNRILAFVRRCCTAAEHPHATEPTPDGPTVPMIDSPSSNGSTAMSRTSSV